MGMARGEMRGDRSVGGARGEPVADLAIRTSIAYAEHAPALRGYLAAYTRDAAAAEDLVHETYLRLLTETAAGRMPVHLRAWLFRVGRNLATSRGRRQGVAARRESELVTRATVPSPEAEILDREAAAALESRLATLPQHARAALLLAAHGYSGAEIAIRIGRSEIATRSLLCRYRERLRSNGIAA